MSSIKPYVIGVSGKMGAGKNYLATKLQEELIKRGYICYETSFAKPLKDQLTEIMHDLRSHESLDEGILVSSEKYDIPVDQMKILAESVKDEIASEEFVTAWVKTQGTRAGLQYLGTDIRRAKKDSYWIDLLEESMPERKIIIFIPDTRFPNEADWVKSVDGLVLRLEVPKEVILARASDRDKIRYSEVSEAHPSETALDSYEGFSMVVGETFNTEELVDKILETVKF